MYGLEPEQIEKIQQVFAGCPKVKEAWLFGSRAKGNYNPGSDIDLALKGPDLALTDGLQLHTLLELLDLPYTFDLVIWDRVKEPGLLDHLHRVGQRLYAQADLIENKNS